MEDFVKFAVYPAIGIFVAGIAMMAVQRAITAIRQKRKERAILRGWQEWSDWCDKNGGPFI